MGKYPVIKLTKFVGRSPAAWAVCFLSFPMKDKTPDTDFRVGGIFQLVRLAYASGASVSGASVSGAGSAMLFTYSRTLEPSARLDTSILSFRVEPSVTKA